MRQNKKQLTIKMLVMYVITSLLFLTSVELHIHTHTKETAATVEHGFAVDVSSLASIFLPEGSNNEIIVSPDSVLKVKQSSVSLLAVFLLIAVIAAVLCRTFIGRLRESQTRLPLIPFYGTPPLRAPPQ